MCPASRRNAARHHSEIPPGIRLKALPGIAEIRSKVLWATEFAAGRLHRLDLDEQGGIAPFGSAVPYQFTGRAPDSMRTDADGNVYVAMFHQARILVFSPNGVPIGQILLPGREQNHFLNVSSMAFLPGSREMVIVAWDELGGRGAMIFKAQGFAKGGTLFSHR